jgi:RNA polymerase sigma-70 factor (ECF subfamily)
MYATVEAGSLGGSGMEASEVPLMQLNSAEPDLVRRLREGAEIAYREFVERYQSEVYRIAHGIMGDRNYADQVVEQVFVKVYFSIKSFDGSSSLYTWVYRMVVNECYGFLRRKWGNVFYADDSADRRPVSDGIGPRRDFLNKLLQRIPEEDRYLLLLRELEGYSVAHLAETTGLSEGTIKVKLLRTRQGLAKAAGQLCCTS